MSDDVTQEHTTPPERPLGVTSGAEGGEIRVWSESAASITLLIYDRVDPDWVVERLPLRRGKDGIWWGLSGRLTPGARYGLRSHSPYDTGGDVVEPEVDEPEPEPESDGEPGGKTSVEDSTEAAGVTATEKLDTLEPVGPTTNAGAAAKVAATSKTESGTAQAGDTETSAPQPLTLTIPTPPVVPATPVFDPHPAMLDPYARGLQQIRDGQWRSVVVDSTFDWGASRKPGHSGSDTVIYEAHVRGLSKQHPGVPPELRGTYAGLAHPAIIDHLTSLGITAIELLPVHASASEPRLTRQALSNYWGYNTLGFFAPHAPYATAAAQAAGPQAVLNEFKTMVRALHEAGIEVILDVVYNHTSEAGPGGPTTSFRGLDDANYYRHNPDGSYMDTTGCGNTLNHAHPVVARLVRDSLCYWATECQVDGFRFDLAATLQRDGDGGFHNPSALINSLRNDPELASVKLIAEPWDVGHDGWRTGGFPVGWSEWNDRFRDRIRSFWLGGGHGERIDGFAAALSGSLDIFGSERGPLASINFVTSHDGFTLADLVSYNQKHNLGNGENNRDGNDHNLSCNFGVEGPTSDPGVRAARRKAQRNLLATLLLSTGIPMLVAGDELGRSQRGNNNAYCHDDPLSWLSWDGGEEASALLRVTTELIRLRRENAALRWGPTSRVRRFAVDGLPLEESSAPQPDRAGVFLFSAEPGAAEVDLEPSAVEPAAAKPALDDSSAPTGSATSAPQNHVLLIVNGGDCELSVTLPGTPPPETIQVEGAPAQGTSVEGTPSVTDSPSYRLLFDSDADDTSESVVAPSPLLPGSTLTVAPLSLQLLGAPG